jgi:hypothetical protein
MSHKVINFADIRQAMLKTLEGGQFHSRERISNTAELPYEDFVGIGLAIKACVLDAKRHDELIARLKPHVDVIIGVLPPGIQSHGLLPSNQEVLNFEIKLPPLNEINDSQIRQWIVDDGSLVYGELSDEELERYFAAISPYLVPGCKFVDLGSGLGKVVMTAALHYAFDHCKGVEILAYRERLAKDRFNHLLKVGQEGFATLLAQKQKVNPSDPIPLPWGGDLKALHLLTIPNRVELAAGDMFNCDVSQAGLVFIYSTCFGSLMGKLAHKLASELPEGAMVSTTTYALNHPALKLVKHFPAKELAWTDVFMYCKWSKDSDQHQWPVPEQIQAPGHLVDVNEWERKAREMLLKQLLVKDET